MIRSKPCVCSRFLDINNDLQGSRSGEVNYAWSSAIVGYKSRWCYAPNKWVFGSSLDEWTKSIVEGV